MPSSYTPSLRLELPVTGELTGTWGDQVNQGITELVDAAIAGTATVSMPDSNYTLTVDNGATDESRRMFVVLTGALTATRDVICPAVSKLYFVANTTSGAQSIVFKTSAGTGITVPNGVAMVLYCNGTNVVNAITYFGSLDIDVLDVLTDLTLPVGTTAQRPTPAAGKVRFNTSSARFEGYDGTEWGQLGGGATGGGADAVFIENGQTVTTSYAIPVGKNALSTGPILIDSGAVVTIPTGSRWLVL
jgi:hypothetical protein